MVRLYGKHEVLRSGIFLNSDLYGRGYSESPKRKLETNDYIIQLALLLQYIGWGKVKVVGFSMVRSLIITRV